MAAAPPAVPVSINFHSGQLRQFSLWCKLLKPDGSVYDYNHEADADLSVDGKVWTISFPKLIEGTYLLLGTRGFHSANALSASFILFQVRTGQSSEWQYPAHQAKFVSQGAVLLSQSETDLQPIYQTLTQNKYPYLERVQNILRRESIDKSPAPAKPK
ncbi:MAG: hypothetical protein JNM56_20195 [Planctomycetia bacterium]|nr:hypothetical protein [Planctomycetia bacterium]